MKNTFKKVIVFMLALSMLSASFSVFAYAAENTVKNVVCTVYKDGATGRGFSWSTDSNSVSDVQIVKTSQYDKNFSKAKTYSGSTSKYLGRYIHHVAVTSLKAGTEYTYRVGDAKKDIWSKKATLKTDNGDSKFSFIAIADVQASSKENFKQAYRTAKAALSKAPNAEFMINLGDYVNDNNNEQWDLYFDTFKSINNTLTHVPVVGNHDGALDGEVTGSLRSLRFKNMFCLDESMNQSLDGVYYSFDYGNAHFAVLNTNDMWPMSQAQRNWLKNDMSNSDAQWKIILAHRSLYSAGKNINKPDTVTMRQMLIPLIDELGIDMVYAGHDHMYLRTAPVSGDAKTKTKYVTEVYNGKSVKFALNPEGTVYTIPSTAGTKRYSVNEDAISPVLDVADKAFSTSEKGGCFCTTEINGNKLIYKAYTVNDKTQKVTLVDQFAIKKTKAKETVSPTNLDNTVITSAITAPINAAEAVVIMLVSYVKLLFQKIAK